MHLEREKQREGERERERVAYITVQKLFHFSNLSRKPGTSHDFAFSNRSRFPLRDPSLKFTFVLPGSTGEDMQIKQRRCCTMNGASYPLTNVYLISEDSFRFLWF